MPWSPWSVRPHSSPEAELALASGPGTDRGARCEKIVEKIAERRGVSVAELESTIKERLTRASRRCSRGGSDLVRARREAQGADLGGHAVQGGPGREDRTRSPRVARDVQGGRAVPRPRPSRAQGTAPGELAREPRAEAGQDRRSPRGGGSRACAGAARRSGHLREDHAECRQIASWSASNVW